MAARLAAAALAALALIVPTDSRAGSSARFAVAVRVVKPLLARTPSVVLRPEAGTSRARRVAGGTVWDASLELGATAPALLALPGAPARPCAGSCTVPVFVPDGAPAAPDGGASGAFARSASGPPASPTSTSGAPPPIPPAPPTIVVTFLPDGAPVGIVER